MNDKTAGRMNRSSNLELLRIFCIIAIIADHFTSQSGVVSFATLQESFFYSTIVSLSRVSCSVFVIISAWFLVDKPFRIRRIFHTWFTVIMYSVPITLAARFVFHISVSKEAFRQAFFPVEESPLWFAGYYIVLVAMSPLLNILIRQVSKISMEIALYVPFVFIVLYSTIACWTGGVFTSDLWVMIFLYLLTGYLKKYSVSFGRRKCLISFLIVETLVCSIKALTSFYAGLNLPLFDILKKYMVFYRGYFQTLPNLIIAYSLFFLFKDLKIRNSKLINMLASASLGVYCLHQVPVFYKYSWSHIFLAEKYSGRGVKTQIYTILVIFIIWLVGTLIELIRNQISNVLIESRHWYGNLCCTIDQFVNLSEQKQEAVSKEKLRRFKRTGIFLFILYFLVVKILTVVFDLFPLLSANVPLEDSQMRLELAVDVHYKDGSVQGIVTVKNNGDAITDISDGAYPIRLGVSLVDENRELTELDYLHLDMGDNFIGEQEEIAIPVQFDGLEEYQEMGGGIRFAIVQEKVKWREDTAEFYWFENDNSGKQK